MEAIQSKKPSSTALFTNLLGVSMTRMNNKGDKRSHCLIPLELGKKPGASLLIKIEKRMVKLQNEIQFLDFLGKPVFSRIAKRKLQETSL